MSPDLGVWTYEDCALALIDDQREGAAKLVGLLRAARDRAAGCAGTRSMCIGRRVQRALALLATARRQIKETTR
jgi:hypothetical protein